jgi:metal-responsive CopG/Arc/MetJ family transcriptional regulator
MAQIERVGVSLEKDLLGAFDKLISQQGYQSRSEAIRDLIRQQLSSSRLRDEVIVLRGKVGEINRVGEKLVSIKGVKLGRINLLATEGLRA